jgi:hypothetical protein
MRWANGQQKVNLAASIVVPIIARFLCAAARISHRSCYGRVRRDNMFFLVRCVFWLWVVFSTIFAQPSSEHTTPRAPQSAPSATALQPVATSAQAWLERAATRVADRCESAPAACLAVAAQLSKLAGSNVPASSWSNARITQIAPDVSRVVNVPLPPRRPQSFARTARPTLEKTARHEYLMDQERAEF